MCCVSTMVLARRNSGGWKARQNRALKRGISAWPTQPPRGAPYGPAAAIEATLQAATGEDGKLHGTLRVDNRNSGTLDRNQLPFSSIVADVGATPDALGFDPLRLDTGAGGQLLGRANISSQGIEVA